MHWIHWRNTSTGNSCPEHWTPSKQALHYVEASFQNGGALSPIKQSSAEMHLQWHTNLSQIPFHEEEVLIWMHLNLVQSHSSVVLYPPSTSCCYNDYADILLVKANQAHICVEKWTLPLFKNANKCSNVCARLETFKYSLGITWSSMTVGITEISFYIAQRSSLKIIHRQENM